MDILPSEPFQDATIRRTRQVGICHHTAHLRCGTEKISRVIASVCAFVSNTLIIDGTLLTQGWWHVYRQDKRALHVYDLHIIIRL